MRTLNISISEIEYNKFGIKNDALTFTEFLDLVSRELTRQNLHHSIEMSKLHGLSQLTMDDITTEVEQVRNNAQSNP